VVDGANVTKNFGRQEYTQQIQWQSWPKNSNGESKLWDGQSIYGWDAFCVVVDSDIQQVIVGIGGNSSLEDMGGIEGGITNEN